MSREQVASDQDGSVPVLAERALPAMAAILLGAFLLWGAGFAHPEAIHNAAHDSRHAFSFPCH